MLLIISKLDPAITGTPPQDENDDMIYDNVADGETQVQPNRAVHNCNIEQEETTKNLLSKFITRKNRAFTIERHNGKDTVVVARPSSKDSNGFLREADRSKWVEKLLPDAIYADGMCTYPAGKHSDNYAEGCRAILSETPKASLNNQNSSHRIRSQPGGNAACQTQTNLEVSRRASGIE